MMSSWSSSRRRPFAADARDNLRINSPSAPTGRPGARSGNSRPEAPARPRVLDVFFNGQSDLRGRFFEAVPLPLNDQHGHHRADCRTLGRSVAVCRHRIRPFTRSIRRLRSARAGISHESFLDHEAMQAGCPALLARRRCRRGSPPVGGLRARRLDRAWALVDGLLRIGWKTCRNAPSPVRRDLAVPKRWGAISRTRSSRMLLKP